MSLKARTSETGEVVRRIIKGSDGGVLVRIGSPVDEPSHSVVTSNHVDENRNVEVTRRLQMAKNAAYRQSTPRQYIEDSNNNNNISSNNNNSSSNTLNNYSITDDKIDSGHMYYTTVSSSKQKTESPTFNTQSVITRKLTKGGRLSTNIDDRTTEIHTTETVYGGNNTNARYVATDNQDKGDTLDRKKLDYKDEGSFKKSPLEKCFCCNKTVYQKEKIGPIRGVVFHKQCFRCCVCGFVLNLTNFCHNSNDLEDRGLYCKSHEPISKSASMNIQDKSIQAALNKPKVEQLNPNIRGGSEVAKSHSFRAEGIYIHPPRAETSYTNDNPPVNHISKVTDQTTLSKPANVEVAYKQPIIINNSRTLISHNGNVTDLYPISMKTAINAPKLDVYNTTVRPDPAIAKTAYLPDVYINRTGQIPGPSLNTTSSPPASPQHVHFNGNTRTYYYINKD